MNSSDPQWTGYASGRFAVLTGVAMGLFALHQFVWGVFLIGAILLGAAAVAMGFSRLTVVIDTRVVTITYGIFRRPRTRVEVSDLVGWRTARVTPWKWGGWGYRGSRTIFKRAAIIVRGGPGLELSTSRSTLLISVDDPDAAVDALDKIVARTR